MRRRSKNSGDGIAPAAIGGLIEVGPCSVNAFRPPSGPADQLQKTDKLLMRLNFLRRTVNG